MIKNLQVRDIMSTDIVTISANDTLVTANKLFSEHNIRHIPVMDEGNLVGIVSTVDYERSKHGKSFFVNHNLDANNAILLQSTLVGMIMTKSVTSIASDSDLKSAYQVFKSKSFRSLPVVDNNRLVGIVTPMDFLDHLFKD